MLYASFALRRGNDTIIASAPFFFAVVVALIVSFCIRLFDGWAQLKKGETNN